MWSWRAEKKPVHFLDYGVSSEGTSMKKNVQRCLGMIGLLLLAGWLACSYLPASPQGSGEIKAFVGARIIDGTGKAAMSTATLIVRNGRIEAVGPSVKVPEGAERIDVAGKTIIPGLINGHGHVNDIAQLGTYARYGVTTVFSLGDVVDVAVSIDQ